ncbi:GHKL domain-containing protein [Lysinibacillus capsici]
METWVAILILFGVILVVLLLHSSIFKICIDLTIIIFIGMMSDQLVQILIDSNKSIFLHMILFIILYSILFFILSFSIHRFKKYYQSISLPLISKVIVSFLFCVMIIVLYLNIFIPTTYDERILSKINLIIQVSYLVIMFFLSMILINNIKVENKIKYRQMQQSQYNEYLTSLEAINTDMQKFRHDYLNILITMEGYITKGNMDELRVYFNNKIVKVENDTLIKNQLMKNISNLEIIELKGLLLTKLLFATEKNISIQIEIPEKILRIPIDIIDFSRILGILIDNAIEASIESICPTINLAILNTSQNSILFVIENTFQFEDLDINKIYSNNYSSKNNTRGYGLSNTLEILKNYPNALLNTRIEDSLFIQEIELNYRK